MNDFIRVITKCKCGAASGRTGLTRGMVNVHEWYAGNHLRMLQDRATCCESPWLSWEDK